MVLGVQAAEGKRVTCTGRCSEPGGGFYCAVCVLILSVPLGTGIYLCENDGKSKCRLKIISSGSGLSSLE